MPSAFTLEGPFGQITHGAGGNLAGTTTEQLNLLTNTPNAVLAILKRMAADLKKGAASNAPVLVGRPTSEYEPEPAELVPVGPAKMGTIDVSFPGSVLLITHDTWKLWDHALKRSGMSGGLPDLGIPSQYNYPIVIPGWGTMRLADIYPGFIGLAGNQRAGLAPHIKRVESALGVPQKRIRAAVGIGAGVFVLAVAGLFVYANAPR